MLYNKLFLTSLAGRAALVLLGAVPALAAPPSPPRVNNTPAKLLESVTLEGVRTHLAAFQAIADANQGNRSAGTPGYDASVSYVAESMTEAGYDVTIQPFQFEAFISYSPSVLELVAPAPIGSVANLLLNYSGSGDVTAPVSVVPGFGCDAADFAGFPAGNIALISRGVCTFAIKADNAFNAGASAVIVYNNIPGELNATLGRDFTRDLPVIAVNQVIGQQLAATPGLVMRVKTDTFSGTVASYNVLAETRLGDAENVVVVGASLDSVSAGPGLQSNGSGSAAVLETALQMAGVRPKNKVRFAWWGAKSIGLIGSTHYVNALTAEERGRIALNLNFDTIASANHVFFVYDGDDSDAVGAGPGAEGSAAIERLFEFYYTMAGVPFKGTDLSGRSDYGPFFNAGIPVGGIFTGAEGIKTVEEAALWGGTAGLAYDPCFQRACDTFDNVSDSALTINADAVAYAVLQFSMNTQAVNGQRGKGNFKPRR